MVLALAGRVWPGCNQWSSFVFLALMRCLCSDPPAPKWFPVFLCVSNPSLLTCSFFCPGAGTFVNPTTYLSQKDLRPYADTWWKTELSKEPGDLASLLPATPSLVESPRMHHFPFWLLDFSVVKWGNYTVNVLNILFILLNRHPPLVDKTCLIYSCEARLFFCWSWFGGPW